MLIILNNILKSLGSLFIKEEKKIELQRQKLRENNKGGPPIDHSQVLKYLFTKNDPMSITTFPYEWEKDFFPPLTEEEKNYMKGEIIKWYETYFELFYNRLIEAVISYVLRPSSKNEWAVKYHKKYQEEFTLMIQDIVDNNLTELIKKRIDKYNDWQIIRWKPVKAKQSWEPPSNEISPILRQLAQISIEESRKEVERQEKETKRLIELQKQDISPEEKKEQIMDALEEYLNKHRKEIVKHCYDRLVLEWKSFPYYYGKMEKKLKNDIFEKYKLQFGCTTYTELFAKVFIYLDKFVALHGEKELRKWIDEQWREFILFMRNDYTERTEDELYVLTMEEFNKYSFSIDFYAIILFKISLDGM